MIWDRTTISCIRNLYTQGDIDDSYTYQHPEAGSYHKQKLAERFQREAEAWLVRVDMRDMAFEESELDWPGTRVKCWWQGSDAVQFVGGPHDGKVLHVDRALLPNDIVLPEPMRRMDVFTIEDDEIPELPRAYSYRLTGWHEDDRQWLYSYEER